MSRNRNIYRAGGDDTFAVSVPILQKILSEPKHKEITTLLYVYLLSMANGPTLRVHTGDILEHTGMSRPTFLKARQALKDLQLIRFTVTTKQGVWQYELLNDTGGKLPTFEDNVKFSELPADIIEAYYASRLQVDRAAKQDESGNLQFFCPFNFHSKSRPTMQVTIDVGQPFHGRYICGHRSCSGAGSYGGLVEFEQRMVEKSGRMISRQQAAQSVRSFAVGRMNGDHLPDPRQVELMEPSDSTVM